MSTPASPEENYNRIRKEIRHESEGYFRRLKRRIQAGLVIGLMVPLLIVSIYSHFQFEFILRKSGKLHLISIAESQRNTMDLFLQERVMNIFSLFHQSSFKRDPSDDDMRLYLEKLREMSDSFIDVGFLDSSGRQVGYAGPYPFLHGRDYSSEPWFRTLMDQEQNYFISDIYLGFRQKPHFTIAVRQVLDSEKYVMRATLDPDKFYLFLRTMARGKGVDSSIVNRNGQYQVVDPDRGLLLGDSTYVPPEDSSVGADEVFNRGEPELVGHAWLGEVPWVLLVRQPLNVAYSQMYTVRNGIIAITAAVLIALIATVIITTENLINRAQHMEESRRELKSQLLHAAKLVSVGELASGVAHEINNPLAIISSQSGVIRDMTDEQFNMELSPESIRRELDIVDDAVVRIRGITQKLLNFVRRNRPREVRCNVNRLIDDVLGGLMEREFEVSNIKLLRNLEPAVPDFLCDPDQLRQVFLNLVNNAGDAIDKDGTITITTRTSNGNIVITVSDTGTGMSPEQMEKIFIPFYTTKEVGKGTGLGLAVSLSIVESMGGRIDVQSIRGAGSSFSVVLPYTETKEESDDH